MKTLIYILLISIIFTSCKSEEEKRKESLREESKIMIKKATAKLIVKNFISMDSALRIISRHLNLSKDSVELGMKYAKHWDSLSSLSLEFFKPKKSNTEYVDYFQGKFDNIRLEKLFGQAPLYGEHANELAAFIDEIYKTDKNYKILSIPGVNDLYEKASKANKEALVNYGKYGEPDKNLLFISSICEAYLKTHLNDPDFEVLKEKYYLKQTNSGYKYKLTIRGNNRLGAKIIKEITFDLKYNAPGKRYYVVSIQE